MRLVSRTIEAPADLGTAVIGVAAGSPMELDLRLESVVEGVLVTGTATVQLRGECVRCLTPVGDVREIEVQELYLYPGNEADEDDASRVEGDKIDLEPVLRDDVVVDLPFQPRCREDCRGLCVDCGADLNADPEHHHGEPLDPRWAQLSGFDPAAGQYHGGRKPEGT